MTAHTMEQSKLLQFQTAARLFVAGARNKCQSIKQRYLSEPGSCLSKLRRERVSVNPLNLAAAMKKQGVAKTVDQ